MKLDPYQEEAVAWLARRRRALVQSPAGSGKTLIAAAALDRVLSARPRDRQVRIGWMCNTVEQSQQAWAAIARYPAVAAQDVTVACAAACTDWSGVSVLVVDEAHHAKADGWRAQVESCPGARWAFTATPPEDPEGAAVIRHLFSAEHLVVERAAVASRIVKAEAVMLDASDPGVAAAIDRAADAMVRRVGRFWQGSPGELRAVAKWQAVNAHGIKGNQRRNAAAAALASAAVRDQRPVLVLANHLDHCAALADAIPGSATCHGKLPKSQRRELLARFRDRDLPCLLSTSLADEGLDLPLAEVLVLVSGGRSKAKAEQRTGRVLRASEGKELATIWDFQDTCHPMMAKHAETREALYRRLGYAVRSMGWKGLTELLPELNRTAPGRTASR